MLSLPAWRPVTDDAIGLAGGPMYLSRPAPSKMGSGGQGGGHRGAPAAWAGAAPRAARRRST